MTGKVGAVDGYSATLGSACLLACLLPTCAYLGRHEYLDNLEVVRVRLLIILHALVLGAVEVPRMGKYPWLQDAPGWKAPDHISGSGTSPHMLQAQKLP